MIFLHFSFSLNFQVFDFCPQAIFTAEQTRDVSEYAIANWRSCNNWNNDWRHVQMFSGSFNLASTRLQST